jgi:malonate-semialdehyde dehydrogenase (acetylating) / methylmalonate-semialdehyde dehydrogenase
MTVMKKDTIKLKNYINGEWIDANSTDTLEVINPATSEVIAIVPLSSKKDVGEAVKAANIAFQTWKNTPVPKRARILYKYHYLLTEHHEQLARLVVQENGKAYKEAYGEVQRGIECVEFAAGAPTLMMGETLSNIAEDIDSEMFRYPLGVVGGWFHYGCSPSPLPVETPLS